MKSNHRKNITVDTVTDEIKTLVSHLEQLSLFELVVSLEILDLELATVLGPMEVVIELSENRKKSFKELITRK